jgi:RNA polymerase sigma-70 factor (ECF subfamily)
VTPNPRAPENLLEHSGYVRELARELVFDANLAHDLEQEIWLAALENVPADLRHPRAWLATVARSLAWRTRRGTRRRADREHRAARNEAVPSSEEVLEREELRAQVVRAVLALDEPYRSALVLRYLEELSPEAAAERLGVPLETLRTRVKRGLQELKRRLERDHGGDHGAWCLALVLELRLEPASTGTLVLKAGTALLTGGLVVGTAQKAIGLAAAVLLLLLGWLVWNPGAPPVRVAAVDAQPGPAAVELDGLQTDRAAAARVAPAQSPATVASAALPEEARAVRLHVEWSDGTPAAGIAVRLSMYASDRCADDRELCTDEHGGATFGELPAGVGELHLDRWAEQVRFDLWGTRQVERTVRLPAGVEFAGHVRTADGRPVGDARILVDYWGEEVGLTEIARSAADGSFLVRDLAAERGPRSILACKDGFAATPRVLLQQAGSQLRTVELVFEAPGGALAGRVLGPQGEPLADALVVAGCTARIRTTRLADGNEARTGNTLETRTDALGAFRLEGLAPGSNSVWVRAPTRHAQSLATWKREVEIAERGTTPLEVSLEPGVEVSGRVTDAADEPVHGASVETPGTRERFSLDGHAASTRPDGSFRLAGLPAGEIELVASSGSLGEARSSFRAAPGARLEWNPSLRKGLTLRGRVERSGLKTGTLDVRAWVVRDGRPEQIQETYALDDGRFEFVNRPDLPHHVAVYGRDALRQPLAELDGVRPGAEDVVLTLDPAAEPRARIHGRVLGADGKPLREARLILTCLDPLGSLQEALRSERGEFALGPFPAGTWTLSIEAPGNASFLLKNQRIGQGEDLDAGTLQLAHGGTAHLRARRADGQPLGKALSTLRAVDGLAYDRVMLSDGEGRTQQLAPGRYWVITNTDTAGLALAVSTVEIAAGEERECEIVLQPGVRVEVAWSDGRTAPRGARAAVTLHQDSGAPLSGAQLVFDAAGVAHTSLCLAPGRYRFESYPAGVLLDEFAVESGATASIERALTYRER